MKKNQLSLFEDSKFTPSLKEFKKETLSKAGFQVLTKKTPPKRKSRVEGIYLPEEKKPLTYGLQFEDKRQRIPEWALPKISTRAEDVSRIIKENDVIGLDFEYNPSTKRLSIVGVATTEECAACSYTPDIGKSLINKTRNPKARFVGHFVLGADKPVLEEATGMTTPLEAWEDSMIAHYLCKAELAKAPGKESDSDGALGFMSLGFAAHLWTPLVMWKECRGLYCEGPCPSHRVFDYCAVDSWAGLMVYNECLKYMEAKGIPMRVYEEHKELALNFCLAAEKRGIHVDLAFARKLEEEMERKKDELFPKGNPRFNPRSNIQVVKWFAKNGVTLKANDKKTTEEVLEEQLFEKYGLTTIGEVEEDLEMDEVTKALYELYLFKSMGKGTDAWVSERYISYE